VVHKEVSRTQYLATMNPTAGSFTVTPRLQRHFATFGVGAPAADAARGVFWALLGGHLAGAGFSEEVRAVGKRLVDAAVDLHAAVVNAFVPR
jgi:dynein heavy chain